MTIILFCQNEAIEMVWGGKPHIFCNLCPIVGEITFCFTSSPLLIYLHAFKSKDNHWEIRTEGIFEWLRPSGIACLFSSFFHPQLNPIFLLFSPQSLLFPRYKYSFVNVVSFGIICAGNLQTLHVKTTEDNWRFFLQLTCQLQIQTRPLHVSVTSTFNKWIAFQARVE